MRFAASVPGLIDLLAVLPFWFAFLVPADLRVLMVLRVVRFLKLARYSPGMRSLLDVLYAERRALAGCLVILIGTTLIAATAMHLVEGTIQPEKFGTIPDAMWWAIVTLGTIGYGDLVPVTALGRLIGAATIFAGLIMIALPVGIVLRGDPPPRLRHHLEHGGAGAAVRRAERHRHRRHHAPAARPHRRARRRRGAPR